MTGSELAERFKAYVSHRMPEAEGIEIPQVSPIFGGASRETFSVELKYALRGKPSCQRLIVRRECEAGIIETSIRTEYLAYGAFQHSDVPVPRLVWAEEDSEWLGRPFYVMEEIVGCQALHVLFRAPPFEALREKVGSAFCRIMGRIAATDPAQVGLEDKLEAVAPGECWRRELDYWEKYAGQNELEPQPVLKAAIRRLRRRPPPPPPRTVIVHGDMRAGNFLFDEKGEIRAVLDWEMMHLGDPLEDLAWSMNRL